MTRTERLEKVIENLGRNMARLQRENYRLECINSDIYFKWVRHPATDAHAALECEVEMNITSANVARIVANERRLKRQTELYGQLLYTYSVMFQEDLSRVLRLN